MWRRTHLDQRVQQQFTVAAELYFDTFRPETVEVALQYVYLRRMCREILYTNLHHLQKDSTRERWRQSRPFHCRWIGQSGYSPHQASLWRRGLLKCLRLRCCSRSAVYNPKNTHLWYRPYSLEPCGKEVKPKLEHRGLKSRIVSVLEQVETMETEHLWYQNIKPERRFPFWRYNIWRCTHNARVCLYTVHTESSGEKRSVEYGLTRDFSDLLCPIVSAVWYLEFP